MMSIEQKKLELPIKTGEWMTLNDIQLSGKKIKYFYKTDNEISNMTNNDIENYKKRWRQNIIQISKNNPNNKSLVHENISLHYFLVDKDNKPILNFEISPNEYKVSLRSSKDVDVSVIAQYFGGGGHKKAAGFTMTGSVYDVLNNLSAQIALQLGENV